MKKKLRIVAIMLALALPISLLAQGGVFQRGNNDETNHGQNGEANKAMLLRNGETGATLSNQGFGNPVNGSNLTNQTFGAPLGSGLLIMLLAGAGYSAMKSSKNNNENKE